MGKISNEMEKLVAILDEQEDLFIKRIRLIKRGEVGKVKFMDERIFPILDEKQNKQALEIKKAFRLRLGGDEHERKRS